MKQLDTLFEDLRARRAGLVGIVRIRAPLGFGRRYLASVVSGFQQDNSDVDIELTLVDQLSAHSKVCWNVTFAFQVRQSRLLPENPLRAAQF